MTSPPPTAPGGPRDAGTSFARALVDEWARAGVGHAVLSPGSRSAPVALALAHDGRLALHVVLDERSAAFFALGIGRSTGRPAVVLCTSGTAAANLHPAVLEAHHGRVPLVVVTADRPPELRDVGAAQTVDQVRIFGSAPRWFHDAELPVDRPGAPAAWRALGARSVVEALGPPPGPVHLNLPFAEPLVPTGGPLVDAPGRPGGEPWVRRREGKEAATPGLVEGLADLVASTDRGVVVAGWGADAPAREVTRFAETAGWPVLADPLSGLREGPSAVSTYDALVRHPAFGDAHRPDLVVRLGAAPTSKALARWLDGSGGPAGPVPEVVVGGAGAWLDPDHRAREVIAASPGPLLDAVAERLGLAGRAGRLGGASAWAGTWRDAEAAARAAIDGHLDADDEPFDGRVARDVHDAVPAAGTLLVASSMPVRDLETFARPRRGVRVLANRGVNGIDGFVSTVLGAAAGSGSSATVALLGDLCLLHDAGGMLASAAAGVDAVLVVVDNDGGGIFSFLAQADHPDDFELLFGAPQPVDVAKVAAGYGIPAVPAERAADVGPAVLRALDAGGVRMVHVRTDRHANVARHEAVWRAVGEAVGPRPDR